MYAEPSRLDHGEEENTVSNPLSSSTEDVPLRRKRREQGPQANSNNFTVEIPKFEGKLDPDEFLEWMHIIEWIFEYKEVTKDKKVKRVALRLRKYTLLWWLTYVLRG